MSLLGRIISLFTPALYLLLIAATIQFGIVGALLVLYVFPVFIYRIHNLFFPLKKSRSFLDQAGYSSWYGSFQIQKIYYDLPFLESILRSCYLYSFWLRCWGSKIGKNVQFTPNIEILDRGMLSIGNNVLLGHRSVLVSHIVVPLKGRPCLFLGPVTIEDNAFIAAGALIGPNCVVPAGSFVEPETRLTLNQVYRRD